MADPPVAEYLKRANLQMGAEAFLGTRDEQGVELFRGAGKQLVDALEQGNDHSSRFTPMGAPRFADRWKVLDQEANTGTGFSSTLFQAIRDDAATGTGTGDLVLFFRSTEFIDEAVRDNQATNVLEIADTGWAWGQISDMEAWYARLSAAGGPLAGKRFSVTGYSLGGHLATAFHLLHAKSSIGWLRSTAPGSVSSRARRFPHRRCAVR